jgi:phosphinothricin acetyltransferase
MPPTIRFATDADAAHLQAIYAPYVRDTVISFELEPPDVAEMAARVHKAVAWLVAADEAGVVLGYAYASKHKERAAYQWSVDVSVYLDAAFHRRGLGRGLYTALFGLLRLQGYVNAYAGITLPNAKSQGLHTALGFAPVGVYRHVGYKFGQWHDVAWLSLDLRPREGTPPPPVPLAAIVASPEAQAAWRLARRCSAGRLRLRLERAYHFLPEQRNARSVGEVGEAQDEVRYP